MHIYDSRGSRSPNACSYCREEGHNVTKCPNVAPDWASWQRMEVPLKDPSCWVHTATGYHNYPHPFRNPRYWGEWYASTMNAFAKQEAALKKKKAPVSRRQSTCGFCGEAGHNRRNCAKMLAFRKKINLANQAVRRSFYDRFVRDLGIGEGALVELSQRRYNYNTRSQENTSLGVCTVLSVDWDNVSITGDAEPVNHVYLSGDLRSKISVAFMTSAGEQRRITYSTNETHVAAEPPTRGNHNWLGFNPLWISQIISSSPTPLDEQWVQDGRKDAFDWLTKKRSYDWLVNSGLTNYVDKWYAIYLEQNDDGR